MKDRVNATPFPTVNTTGYIDHAAFLGTIFFFQAEDGIRDGHVTGVQTCALPICRMAYRIFDCPPGRDAWDGDTRSEERRVGKEWRCRWLAVSFIINCVVALLLTLLETFLLFMSLIVTFMVNSGSAS